LYNSLQYNNFQQRLQLIFPTKTYPDPAAPNIHAEALYRGGNTPPAQNIHVQPSKRGQNTPPVQNIHVQPPKRGGNTPPAAHKKKAATTGCLLFICKEEN
jgi:hypothetical protein